MQLFGDHKHICLTLHCLRNKTAVPKVHAELSIEVADLDILLTQLSEQGYRFCLPQDAKSTDKTCSITFDDGYYNNSLFLDLAEKYQIPFILFVASYNIVNQTPYVWDIMKSLGREEWGFAEKKYTDIYQDISGSDRATLMNPDHRPFSFDELRKFEAHPLVYLALHSHTHQPLVGAEIASIDTEIDKNLEFLKSFKKVLSKDFALPNGMYSRETIEKLKTRCDRIYTIQGGGYSVGQSVISRISLVNPDFGGDLLDQISKSFSLKRRVLRKFVSMRYA